MSVVLTGFDEYIKKLKDAPKAMMQRVDAEVEDAAREWEQKAKQSAPADHGFLRNGITSSKEGTGWSVMSRAHYSAYMEWGTGTKVDVPAELTDYAYLFKGKIQVVGIHPRPFFFIHKLGIQQRLLTNLKTIVDNI